ncbi:MAG TPA: DUF2190 family protein [Novosphingobium sp.]|nr:DUF2190 family protein [Novosphingobium sp.]
MKNYVQPGDNLTLPAPYDRKSGQGALIGAIFGIASNDVEAGDDGVFVVKGVFDHAKTASQAWTLGAKIYWDNTARVLTNVASGNTLVGAAVAAVAGGANDTTGRVRLNGSF